MELDLSMRQTKAVFVLARLAPASITGLGRTLGVSEPTASLLVEELVSKHLAIRANDPSDRRRTLVELTDEGKALVDKFQAAWDRQMMNWLELLDEEELQAVLAGLEMMVRAAERCNATPKED
jgi:DNA-binding MarR family transcriptional regulator